MQSQGIGSRFLPAVEYAAVNPWENAHPNEKKNKQGVNLQMNLSTGPMGKNLLTFLVISPQSWRRRAEGNLHWATPPHISQEDESLLHLDKTPRLRSLAVKQDNLSAFGSLALSKNSGWDVMRRGLAGKRGIEGTLRLCRSRSQSGRAWLKPKVESEPHLPL